jgi:hypothetical protein
MGYNIKCDYVHGELKHTPKINSIYWSCEHTWVVMHAEKYTFYIDCTSSQFQWMFKNIPDYYISTRKPKWYLPDSENIAFSKLKICKWLMNHKIKSMPVPIFFTYKIWAPISDLLHEIFYKKI